MKGDKLSKCAFGKDLKLGNELPNTGNKKMNKTSLYLTLKNSQSTYHFKEKNRLVVVAQVYNPSYLGGGNGKDCCSKPTQPRQKV
jgi:hypothetical protein